MVNSRHVHGHRCFLIPLAERDDCSVDMDDRPLAKSDDCSVDDRFVMFY